MTSKTKYGLKEKIKGIALSASRPLLVGGLITLLSLPAVSSISRVPAGERRTSIVGCTILGPTVGLDTPGSSYIRFKTPSGTCGTAVLGSYSYPTSSIVTVHSTTPIYKTKFGRGSVVAGETRYMVKK